jgi:hypothetical protein
LITVPPGARQSTSGRPRGSFCLGLVAAFALMMFPRPPLARAEVDGWSSPVKLSGYGPQSGGWFPAIAADMYGDVHVVWQEQLPVHERVPDSVKTPRLTDQATWLLHTRWNGQKWSTPNQIAAGGLQGLALRSTLTTTSDGRLHIIYRGLDLTNPRRADPDQEPLRYSSADSSVADRVGTWSPGQLMSLRVPAYFPAIAADHQGGLHAIWTEALGPGTYVVYYRRSTDGGEHWTSPRMLDSTRAATRWRLQLEIGPRDDLNAVWEVVDPSDPTSRDPIGFVYANSPDRGETWSIRPFVPSMIDGQYARVFDGTRLRLQPAVGIDGRGQTILVWREQGTDQIYWQRSLDPRSWSSPERLPGIAKGVDRPFDRYAMATDSAGRVHLFTVGFLPRLKTMALLHSEWSGFSWSDPHAIYVADSEPFPEYPAAAIANGNELHVVWFGGSLPGIDRTPTGIWHNSTQTSAPTIAPTRRPALVAPVETSALQKPAVVRSSAPTDKVQTQPGSTSSTTSSTPSASDNALGGTQLPLLASTAATLLLIAGAYGLRSCGWLR